MNRIPRGRNENCRTLNACERARMCKLQTYIRLPKKKLRSTHWPYKETHNIFVLHSCPLLLSSSSKMSSAHYSLTNNATAKHVRSSLVQWPLYLRNELLKTQQSIPRSNCRDMLPCCYSGAMPADHERLVWKLSYTFKEQPWFKM